MQLLSLTLKNIRSYLEEKVDFPEGSVLLSGDIGSGKSTILLAVEFALFGILSKQLPGGSLLRHGTTEGSVELVFKLQEKEVRIRRVLKKTSTGIRQSAGFLIINGVRIDATPVELKAKVLELLGYPDELVSKNKSFIFRYTVYTPQEDMLQILTEKDDDRLDTLRRVFGLDKYKRIRENTAIYLKEVRKRKLILNERLKDTDEIVSQLAELTSQRTQYAEQYKQNKEQLEELQKRVEEQKEERVKKEAACDLIKETRIKKEELLGKLHTLEKEGTLIGEEKKRLQEFITNNVLEETSQETPEDELKKIREKIKNCSEKVKLVEEKTTFFVTKKGVSEDVKKSILEIASCPTCLQPVSQDHKDAICTKEDTSLTKINDNLERLSETKQRLEEILLNLEERQFAAEEKLKEFLTKKAKQEELLQKKKRKEQIEERESSILKEKEEFEKQLTPIQQSLKEETLLLKELAEAKEKESTLTQQERVLLVKVTEEKERCDALEKELLEKEKKVEVIKKNKADLDFVAELDNWLQVLFMNLVYVVEKHVLLKIHTEFDQLFQNWFSVLIEDSVMSVRLDDSFSPSVLQNGHETTFLNLSGGERTSVALAYRLALNRVINDFCSTIQTKDLLILDEPTDGFSSEQLDKVRDLLEELNTQQIVLVSHESKVEGFVDHLLRVVKEGHESKILSS
ncbi:hypothetical protein CMO92_05060 [Candidatus Woesearchaeota archaeon]|nr:hypothetical protein [Candidatus Woesearchaeota archaeon]